MLQEFKDFINKGGVFEAAVGLILALAFAPIVNSMVEDMIMPLVGRIFGQPDFSTLSIDIGKGSYIRYGLFINTIISFVMIAAVIFVLVKAYNNSVKKTEEEDGPSEVDLLTEIRDSLAK